MTAKDYLSQGRFLDARISSKIRQVEQLNQLATRATSALTGMPHSPNKATSKMADVIGKMVDLQAEINRDIDELVELKHGIGEAIKAVENMEYQTLLEKRYLCFLPWEKIAVDMGYGIDNIFKLHKRALSSVVVPESVQ